MSLTETSLQLLVCQNPLSTQTQNRKINEILAHTNHSEHSHHMICARYRDLTNKLSSRYQLISAQRLDFLAEFFLAVQNKKIPVLLNTFWNETQLTSALEKLAVANHVLSNFDRPVIFFTSGTTSSPKLILHERESLIRNATLVVEHLHYEKDDVTQLSLPEFHIGGLSQILRAIVSQSTLLLSQQKNEFHPLTTRASFVPTQLYRYLNSNENSANNLRSLHIGGAPAGKSLLEKAYQAGLPVVKTYGMTETASQVTSTHLPISREALFTSGQPLKDCDVEFDHDGRISVRSPSLLKGFVQDTEFIFVREVYKTQDLGEMTSKGLVIFGRTDAVINVGGEKIHPQLLIETLLEFPGVVSCDVKAAPDAEYGQVPIAYIQMDDAHHELPVEALKEWCQSRLPGFYRPKSFIPYTGK